MKGTIRSLTEIEKAFLNHLLRSGMNSQNTSVAYKNDVRKFVSYCLSRGISGIIGIQDSHVIEYFESIKLVNKESTLRRNASSLKAFFRFVKSKTDFDLLSSLKKISIPKFVKTPKDILNPPEVEGLFESFKGNDFFSRRDKAIFAMLYFAGLRVSELCTLKMKNISLDKEVVEIVSKYKRKIPLSGSIKKALSDYLKAREQVLKTPKRQSSGFLFVDRSGNSLTRQSIYLIVRKRAEEAGIDKKISPQTLRNSIAIHLLSNGANSEEVKEMLGYKIIQTDFQILNAREEYKSAYLASHPILRDK